MASAASRSILALVLAACAAGAAAAPNPVLLGCGPRDLCAQGGPAGGDGQPDPGEEILLDLPIENRGTTAASNLRVLVSVRDAELTLLQDAGSYPVTVPAGATVTLVAPVR